MQIRSQYAVSFRHAILAATFLAGVIAQPAMASDDASADNDSEHVGASDILVTGQLEKAVNLGGALGSRAILDTPLSVTTVSRDDLVDRGVTALGDVFARDAAVTSQGDSNTIYSSNISVRGLQLDAANGYKINGLPIYNFGVELPVAFFDRVDLLKGSSGFLYGFGAPGGIVNYVTAKPTAEPRFSFDAGYRSDSIWSAHVDMGGPIADQFLGYRLNVLSEDGTALNGGKVNNKAVALSLASQLTSNLQWTFDGIYQKRETADVIQGIGTSMFTGTELPSAPSGSDHLPATKGSFFNTEYYLVSSGLRWQVAPDWTISANVSRSGNTRRFSFDFAYLLDETGNYRNYVNDSQSRNQFDQGQVIAEGSFRTGPISHAVVLGASVQRYLAYGNVNQVFAPTGTSNLYTGSALPYSSTMVINMYRSAEITQRALFASDTMQLLSGLSALVGIRWTDYEQNGYATTGAQSSRYGKKPITPTFALLYKPSATTTFYASYVESLEQGTIVSSVYANRDALLSPLRSKQYEAGFKVDQKLWSGSAAVFSVQRGAGYANAANEYVQDGYALYQGIDVNARIRPTESLSIGASALWLDAEYKKTSTAIQGNRVEGTPKFQASGDVTYRVPAVPGLSASANIRRNGNGTVDSAAQLTTSGYTLYGLGLKYDTSLLGHSATFRGNLANLTDKRYWYYIQPGFIYPGEARTLSVSAQFTF
jgi:iron complex outermembrane receptor protein